MTTDGPSSLPSRLGEWRGTERYQVRRFIGAGSMGAVYEAFDRERCQLVALKRLRHFSPAALYLFKQEFRGLVDVVHSNLVRLYELVATDPHDIFFSMELVRGSELLDHVRMKDPPDTTRLRAALRQLVEGLQALHAAGKVHRDVKPSNVLVTPEGRVVLLDFGVATDAVRAGGPSSLDDHAIVGTAAYMAPEQASGEGSTTASDWYSVGAVIYEVLIGRPPLVGTVSEVLRAKETFEPDPPSHLNARVPPDLDELCVALLARSPAARPSGTEILRRLGVAGRERVISSKAGAERSRALVGRSAHLERLRDALKASRRQAVTVQVGGLSGMGKSALVQEFLDDLVDRGEAVALRGRAYQRESVPYKAIDSWIDALSRYLLRLSDQGAQVPIGDDAWALARLFPVLRRVPEIADARERLIADPQRLRRLAFGALRDILGALGQKQPLIVSIDDAHWGDADSAALLLELIRPPEPPPILLLMTFRHEERASVFLQRLRTEWPAGGADLRELTVGPLDTGDARALALAILDPETDGAEAMASDIARESGGSPLLLEELARSHHGIPAAGAITGPMSLEHFVSARLEGLPDDARHLFELVALAGRPLPTALLAAAAHIQGGEDQVEALRARRFVRIGLRHGLEVVETNHARVADAISRSLPAERARAHNAELARALQASTDADPESVALQLVRAGDKHHAGPFAERAAEDAIGRLAFDRATEMFRLALEAQAPGSHRASALRVRLAEALALAGRGQLAARAYREAAEAAEGIARLELQRAAADQLLICGRIDEGGEALRQVLAAMGLAAPQSTLASIFWLLVYRVWLTLRTLRFEERDATDVRHEDRVRIDTMLAVAMGFSIVDVLLGACMLTRCLLLALRAGDRTQVLRAACLEGAHRASAGGEAGRTERALIDIGRRLAARIGDPESQAFVDGTFGFTEFLRGRWKQARKVLDASTQVRASGIAQWQANEPMFATNSCFFTGELQELLRRHSRVNGDALERGDLYTVVNLASTTTITVHLAADEPETARRQLRDAMRQWSQSGFLVQQWQAMAFEPDIELYVGDGAAAYDRFARDLPALRSSFLLQVQFTRAITLYTQGRCAVASVEARPALRGQRIAEARRCARRLKRENMPWIETLAHTVEATVENAAGRRDACIAALRALVASAERTDMAMHARVARYRLGQLLGGAEGAALFEASRREIESEGVRNVPAMVCIYLPGRWTASSAGAA